MLAKGWIYIIHNLALTFLALGMLKQMFYIKSKFKTSLLFVLWIQLVFIFNDFIIEARFPLEVKYVVIFLGFSFGMRYIIRLPFVATVLVMIINLTINGLATNLNITTLLLTQFESYGIALENDFIQYSSLMMMNIMMYLMLKTFNVRILDISRYN